MTFSSTTQGRFHRFAGFAWVIGLHLVLGWALASGFATQVVKRLNPPVQVALIAEVPPPQPLQSPPPPPPAPEVPKSLPLQKAVAAAQPVAAPPVTAAPAAETPSPIAITPTPTAPAAAPEAAASPAPMPLAAPALRPAPQAMGLVCPTQISPEMPRRAVQESLSGRVEARATVRGGRVVAVEILSARPRGVFDAAVKRAMLQYRCENRGEAEVQADQVFDFKIED